MKKGSGFWSGSSEGNQLFGSEPDEEMKHGGGSVMLWIISEQMVWLNRTSMVLQGPTVNRVGEVRWTRTIRTWFSQ